MPRSVIFYDNLGYRVAFGEEIKNRENFVITPRARVICAYGMGENRPRDAVRSGCQLSV